MLIKLIYIQSVLRNDDGISICTISVAVKWTNDCRLSGGPHINMIAIATLRRNHGEYSSNIILDLVSSTKELPKKRHSKMTMWGLNILSAFYADLEIKENRVWRVEVIF